MHMSRFLPRPFLVFLAAAAIVSGLVLLVCVAVQQDLRLGADEPQLWLAEDGAAAIAGGARPTDVVPTGRPVDLATSLAPFVAVYGADGKPLAADATLDGALPAPPVGVFAFAAAHGEHRVSWQPRPTLRFATVIVPIPGGGGFVLAGRSLREVEKRENLIYAQCLAAWLAAVFLAATGSWLVSRRS